MKYVIQITKNCQQKQGAYYVWYTVGMTVSSELMLTAAMTWTAQAQSIPETPAMYEMVFIYPTIHDSKSRNLGDENWYAQ